MNGATFDSAYQRASPIWRERLRAFRAAHTPQSLVVNGQQWRYLAGGQGQRVALLLHGSECDAESLFGAMTLLEREYYVLAPTYPESADSVEQVCAGLVGLLEATSYGPALVVGYSLGGYLAQAFAARRPDLAPRLALCNTGAPAVSALRMVWLQYALFAVAPGPLLLSALRAGAGVPLWREASDLTGPDRAFWRVYLAEMASRLSKRAILAHGRIIADFLGSQLTPPAALATTPGRVLLLDSAQDHTIEAAERAALGVLYPTATRRLLPVRGHLSFLTRPELFVEAIEREFSARRVGDEQQAPVSAPARRTLS